MEIVPGLHQLKTPMVSPALPYVLPYALVGRDGVSLFDSGFGTPQATETMTAELRRLGYAPADVQRVIVSHAHPDHLGMIGWLKEQSPGCEVVMLEREWEWFRVRWLGAGEEGAEGEGGGPEAWLQRSDAWLMRHGVPQEEIEAARQEGSDRPPGAGPGSRGPYGDWGTGFEPEVKLQDGDVLEFDGWALEAVWTPGHTPGHLCMFVRNHRLMFTGDHVLPHISPNVSLHEDQEGTSPLSDFRASLKKVAAFDTDLALPAHEFTMPDLPARCATLLHHHDGRLDEVRNAIGEGAATARDISSRVHWNTGPFEEFGLFMKRSALGETLSHLQLLLDEGRVNRRDSGDVVLWERA